MQRWRYSVADTWKSHSLQAGVSGGHVAIIIIVIIIVRHIMQQIEGTYYTYFLGIAQCDTCLLYISYFTNEFQYWLFGHY